MTDFVQGYLHFAVKLTPKLQNVLTVCFQQLIYVLFEHHF